MNIAEAARKGDIEKVKEYLQNSVNPNFIDCDGNTALIWASFKGYLEIVKILLEYGADVDLKDEDTCCTPLHHASSRGYFSIVKILLDSRANPKLLSRSGKNALFLAIEREQTHLFPLFQKYCNLLDKNDYIFLQKQKHRCHFAKESY